MKNQKWNHDFGIFCDFFLCDKDKKIIESESLQSFKFIFRSKVEAFSNNLNLSFF